MAKIYTTQDYLQVRLTYTADVADEIASVVIKYRTPGATATSGSWSATHVSASKYVYYNVPASTFLSTTGRWTFWIGATMNDGRYLPGEEYTEYIHVEGASR